MQSESGFSLGSMRGILSNTTLPGDDAALHAVVSGMNGVLSGVNGRIEDDVIDAIGVNGRIEGSHLPSHHSNNSQNTGRLSNPSASSSFVAGSSGGLSGSTGRVLGGAVDQNVSARMPPINEDTAEEAGSPAHVPTVRYSRVNMRKLSNSRSGAVSRELCGADSASFLGGMSMQSSAWTISGGGDVHGAVDSHFCDSTAALPASGEGASDALIHGAYFKHMCLLGTYMHALFCEEHVEGEMAWMFLATLFVV